MRMSRRSHLLNCAAILMLAVIVAGCAGFGGRPDPESGAIEPTANGPKQSQEPDPVRDRLKSMSLGDKIGQLVMVGLDGTQADTAALSMVTEHKVGGFILYKNNMESVNQTLSLLNALKKANANAAGVPLFFGVDQEGGRVSRMPAPIAALPGNREIGALDKPEFSTEVGRRLGEMTAALGFNVDFAPVLDVDSNPRNPVIGDRSFGPSAALVSRLGIATMEGIRSRRVVPVVKHFPGHGDTSVDSHRALPVVDKGMDELKRLELIPFADAIRQQADAVMVAHILLPRLDADYPASLSKKLVTDVLRGEMQFSGVVITDDLTMGAVLQNYSIGEAAVLAVQAGADILLVAHDQEMEMTVIRTLTQSVEDGVVPLSRVDESVYRILKLKQKYGLTDNTVEQPDLAALNGRIAETIDRYMPASGKAKE